MPITVEVVDETVGKTMAGNFKKVFAYFNDVDKRYSTYKPNSEISQINDGLPRNQWSREMKQVIDLCEQTKQQTAGYFDIKREHKLDPSGLVKGWAIRNAANTLLDMGYSNFYIEAGGDIQAHGLNANQQAWSVGIRNPFKPDEIIKVLKITNGGVATSGTYIRGTHIYNPHDNFKAADAIKSMTVIGPDIYEADRFATAAFAMGPKGIDFIEQQPNLEGYSIGADKVATFTSGFDRFVGEDA